jgi:hypothetical protein
MEQITKLCCLMFAIKKRRKEKTLPINTDTATILAKADQYIPDYALQYKSTGDWVFQMKAALDRNLEYYFKNDIFELKTEFISLCIESYAFCSSTFKYKRTEGNVDEIPDRGVISVNMRGIFFFPPRNFKRPAYRVRYEDVIKFHNNISGLRMDFLTQEGQHGFIKIKSSRTEELVEDIQSYELCRVRESNKLYYAGLYIFEDEYQKITNPSIYVSPKSNFIDFCYQQLKEENVNFENYSNFPFSPSFYFRGMENGLNNILIIVDKTDFWDNRERNRIDRNEHPERFKKPLREDDNKSYLELDSPTKTMVGGNTPLLPKPQSIGGVLLGKKVALEAQPQYESIPLDQTPKDVFKVDAHITAEEASPMLSPDSPKKRGGKDASPFKFKRKGKGGLQLNTTAIGEDVSPGDVSQPSILKLKTSDRKSEVSQRSVKFGASENPPKSREP